MPFYGIIKLLYTILNHANSMQLGVPNRIASNWFGTIQPDIQIIW